MPNSTPLFISHSVRSLHHLLVRRRLSARELVQECCSRLRKFDKRFKVMVASSEPLMSAAARSCDERLASGLPARALEAMPIGVKDIFNTAEYPTQMGSPLWKGFTPGNDARTVFYIRQAGAIVAGKTVTAEFAVHTLGPTLNPHDVSRTPGTSSSGSAAGVALGIFPLALGTQTAGSIVRPASFCGVFGCKPSFGLVPRTGMLKTTDSLDTVGFFAHHAEDIPVLFDVLRVHGLNYPISNAALNDPLRHEKPKNRPWKVAFCRTHTWRYAPQYAQDALVAFANKLSRMNGVDVAEITLPDGMARSHEIHASIYNKSLSYYFKDEYRRHELVSPIMNDLIKRGNSTTASVYQSALREQEALAAAMDRLMSRYDVLFSLSTAGEAPVRNIEELPDPSLMWTMTHLPVIGVPQFRSPSGLPFGVQFAARRYSDYLLFNFISFLSGNGVIPSHAAPLPRDVRG